MIKELSKTYDPQEIEQPIYEWWEREGYFRPEKQVDLGIAEPGGPRFSITIPPPNVTGALHLGHAIVAALEDLMTRYYRMLGRQTLYLPGTDHAGIATQNVVERELRKQGISRKDLGRERFIEKVWEWKEVYHARITNQTRRLGVSCDWTRERFTLDEQLSHAVRTAFVRLFKKGLIYRGPRLVNWCPRCESAISDLEAVSEEHDGSLWYIRYPVISDEWSGPAGEWGSGAWAGGAAEFIEVATTRPETLLGDTGVATRSDHARFGKLIGREAVLPVLGRRIPIFTDYLVDPEFGTGAVKITPAHDPNDFEIGARHGLEQITVMNERAQMNELAGPYAGMDRFAARRKLIEDLDKEGLLIKIEPHKLALAHCERCHTIVEPRISTQWFVNTRPLAEPAIEAIKSGETIIIPEREERRFYHWMENIHDWCISRQLWWGHRIPVWYCDDCGGQTCEMVDPSDCAHCGGGSIRQDEDVLDTWFSSGLWPFSTLGWPDVENPDFTRYYPTDMRETGYDILFFWVAREMMLGIEMTGKAPYKVVYLHGIVRNQHGVKISKSMENIEEYDPLNIIERYGADSLRYTLVTSSTPGIDTNLDPTKLEGGRRFCNKIWQASRLVLGNVGEGAPRLEEVPAGGLHLTDRWILSRLNRLIKSVNTLFDEYQYGEAGRQINDFFWSEYCDWYLEVSKVRLYSETADKNAPKAVLLHVLRTCLRLLHPFMPYITEALWQALPESGKTRQALIVEAWPAHDEAAISEEVEDRFDIARELIYGIRKLRSDYQVEQRKRITAQIAANGNVSVIESMREETVSLCKLDPENLLISESLEVPEKAATVVTRGIVAYIPISELIDVEAERLRLGKELREVEEQIVQLEAKLAGEFSAKAPAQVVQRERNRLAELQAKQFQLSDRLSGL